MHQRPSSPSSPLKLRIKITTSRNVVFIVFILVGSGFLDSICLTGGHHQTATTTTFTNQSLPYPFQQRIFTLPPPPTPAGNNSLVKGTYFDGSSGLLPSSFAILINLGLDGQPRNMYSSHSHNPLCERRGQQIWDPFSRQCRQLFCKDHYQIKDLKCVEDEGHGLKQNGNPQKQKPKSSNSSVIDSSATPKPYLKFLDSKWTFVNVTLDVTTSRQIDRPWLAAHAAEFASQFSLQFAAAWAMPAARLVNVSVAVVSPYAATVNFLIKENDRNRTGATGKCNDDILAGLSELIVSSIGTQGHNQLRYYVLERTWTAVAIHTTLAEMTDFCLRPEDMPIWYWNSEFTIVSVANATMIYVNATGRLYFPGEYMATVLAVEELKKAPSSQSSPYSSTEDLYRLNVSSNAVVCEQTLINEDCPRILLNRSEYEFIGGRRLFSIADGRFFSHYELTDNQSVFVCLKRHPHKKFNKPLSPEEYPDALDRKVEAILSTTLMIVSISMLSATLVTLGRLRSLRSTVNGFNSLHLVACLAVMQVTFLGNQYIPRCRLPAAAFHFTILCTVSWSSVIAFDMHRVFVRGSMTGVTRPNTARVRLLYCAVAYLLPLSIVLLANLGDLFSSSSSSSSFWSALAGDYGPVLPSNVCWMRRRAATIAYFVVPVTLTVAVNAVLYLRIVCNIRRDIASFSSLKKVTRIPSNSSQSSSISIISSCEGSATTATSNRLDFKQTSIFLRLSVPLGFTWIIAFFGTVVPAEMEYHLLLRIMAYLFIVANTSQGVTLFFALGIYRKLFARE